MLTLFHHPMLAACRFVRLAFGEYGEELVLIEEKPWARRKEFLALNPAATLPVLLAEGDVPIVGASVIAEYLDETRGVLKRERRLFAEDPMDRAEIRRLADWYLTKTESEVTRHLVRERVLKPLMPSPQGGGSPDAAAIRAARANIRQHMKYTNWLAGTRNWLAGGRITYADLAAAASISILDYLGEIDWTEYPSARDWYSRLKSRPSFRPLLGDRVRGLTPVSHYADLDFSDPSLRDFIDREAKRLGFDGVAVASPNSIPLAPERLAAFVKEGQHGSMQWIAETAARRGNPSALWPDVRSIVMLAMNYGPDSDPLVALADRNRGAISVYAQNRDYHDVIKGKLKELAGKIAVKSGGDVKVFVDTAPVMEKPLAEAAGLGWQGKHTNLVSREFGSWLFLGSIFTTAELAVDTPEEDHCGTCRACLDICPTNAFPAPYRLDARRCISYLTIENKGPIPREFRTAIGNRIYGCDDCLAVCPWNKFAQVASEAKLVARDELRSPPLGELLALDDAGFRTLFSGSPVKRIGRDRFLRNVLIAAGNSGDVSLLPACHRLLEDASPLVRGAAVWALSQLLPEAAFAALAERHIVMETDGDVLGEWSAVTHPVAAGVAA